MVLYGSLYGRVGRCRDILCYTNQQKPSLETGEAFLFCWVILVGMGFRKRGEGFLLRRVARNLPIVLLAF
jgi:hypothetical protein